MNHYQFEFGLDTVVRVDKKKARAMYDAGKMVIVYMIHDNVESPYNHGFTAKKDLGILKDHAFDAWVNEFEYYNGGCGRGRYAKYFIYIEEERK